jgi:hypothetical protein
MDDIQQLKKVRAQLIKLEKDKSEKANRKKFILNDQKETLLLKYLLEDESSERLIKRNEELLNNRKLVFKVSAQGEDFIGTHAIKLSGAITNNGFLYMNNVKNMFPFPYLSRNFYPKSFHGNLSWTGKSTLNAGKTGFSIVGSRIPNKLEGFLGKDNSVHVKTTESEFEWTGYGYIERLVCDPFNGNESNRSEYLENRLKLYRKMIKLEELIIK